MLGKNAKWEKFCLSPSVKGKLFRQFHKTLQQLQADFLAFLRVKLRGENIIAPDGTPRNYCVGAAMRQIAQRPPRFDMK